MNKNLGEAQSFLSTLRKIEGGFLGTSSSEFENPFSADIKSLERSQYFKHDTPHQTVDAPSFGAFSAKLIKNRSRTRNQNLSTASANLVLPSIESNHVVQASEHNHLDMMKYELIKDESSEITSQLDGNLRKLQSSLDSAKKKVDKQSLKVGTKVNETINMLPPEVLLKHNKMGKLRERASKRMYTALVKLFPHYLGAVFLQWKRGMLFIKANEKKIAGATISRIARGFLGRLRYRRLKEQWLHASSADDRLRMLRAVGTGRCATLIQKVFRAFRVCRIFTPIIRRHMAARRITKFMIEYTEVRRCRAQLRQRKQRQAAAITLQCLIRGHLSRAKVKKLKVVRYRTKLQDRYNTKEDLFRFYFEQVGAATRIQKWFRALPWRRKKLWRKKYQRWIYARKWEMKGYGKSRATMQSASKAPPPAGGLSRRMKKSEIEEGRRIRREELGAATINRLVRGFLAR